MSEQKPARVLICGKAAQGKTFSLRHFEDDKGVYYINAEGKGVPFRNNFYIAELQSPLEVFDALEEAESLPDVHTIIIDGFNYLMDWYETDVVNKSADTRKAWGTYAVMIKDLTRIISQSSKNVIVLAHVHSEANNESGLHEYGVPIKGSAAKTGLESYFDIVVYARSITLGELNKYGKPDPDLIHISPEEDFQGLKYVFQLIKTRDMQNAKIRSLANMWKIPVNKSDTSQVFMDNNTQILINKIREYYSEESDV